MKTLGVLVKQAEIEVRLRDSLNLI